MSGEEKGWKVGSEGGGGEKENERKKMRGRKWEEGGWEGRR